MKTYDQTAADPSSNSTNLRFFIRLTLGVVGLLLIPLVAMQFTAEVNWAPGDFFVAGVMLFTTGILYWLVTRKSGNGSYRKAAGVMVVAVLLLTWVNLAVGIIGSDNDPANVMYLAVLAVAFFGSLAARLRPRGMARTAIAAAVTQALVAVVAIVGKMGVSVDEHWPRDIVGATLVFILLWLTSATLFRRASQRRVLGHRGTERSSP